MKSKKEQLYDANYYIESFEKCKKESIWKSSVQKYEMNLLRNINRQIKSLKEDTYKPLPFNEFTLTERGKTRQIKAVCIEDRVMIKILCEKILTPEIRKYLIHDNGASLKGKGVQFARDRFEMHLHKYYRKRGSNEGYILLMDFSKFFDNIQHEKLIEQYEEKLKDKELISFIKLIIDSFKVDVSYLSDKEYEKCLNHVFNVLDHADVDKDLLTGEKYMKKSIGIGSQISQISGLLYPHRIDNYCKIVKGLKFYGRYMDDTYVIHESKEYLNELLKEIEYICKEYGIFINKKKTQIVKMSKVFTFLKVRYVLTDTGKLIKRINKETVIRERRKLKKFRKKLDNGEMNYKDIEDSYKSWRGNLKCYSSYHALKNMDNLYNELFIKSFKKGEIKHERKNEKNTGNGTENKKS